MIGNDKISPVLPLRNRVQKNYTAQDLQITAIIFEVE